MRCFLIAVSLLCGCTAANAECVARSAATRTHLVELFTSEGCSSCPPADAWLRGLRASDALVALEWHVDYWDALGWPDRFDDARYTARQRELAARSDKDIVYTPEVALDGHEWRDWGGDLPPSSENRASGNLNLHVIPGQPLRVALQSTMSPLVERSGYRAYFVVTEDGLSSAVRAGENDGVVLHHNHTVRAFAGPLPLDRAQAELRLPTDLRTQNASVIAFVQDPRTGTIAQVVRQPLARCPR
ncbi:MAG: DUF1223 domain-containing protein [Rhodanobacteraceae bacterium]